MLAVCRHIPSLTCPIKELKRVTFGTVISKAERELPMDRNPQRQTNLRPQDGRRTSMTCMDRSVSVGSSPSRSRQLVCLFSLTRSFMFQLLGYRMSERSSGDTCMFGKWLNKSKYTSSFLPQQKAGGFTASASIQEQHDKQTSSSILPHTQPFVFYFEFHMGQGSG